ncbi:adhesion G protein-coupled receptor E2-like [Scyliorhinus canicula]|uniref:adhesion G protein-coupled receptor E2-like n=1 Tax=Scyliorhinus canicula TaxID=7830 RepID=UPI0018F5CD3E|nr:adhesion G protein-coupled receptor E2-like [Scyliorhinus canicula]
MEPNIYPVLGLILCTLVGQCSAACPTGREEKNGLCVAPDVCLSYKCPPASRCRNSRGAACFCNEGFYLCLPYYNCTTGRAYCADVDECKKKRSNCGAGATCVNTIGSYCCVVNATSGKESRKICSECEYNCYFNKEAGVSNSTVSEQMCMSSCQMEALYKNMSRISRTSGKNGKGTQFLDNAENILMSLVETPSKRSEERKSMLDSEIVIRRQRNPQGPIRISAEGNSIEVEQVVFAGRASGRQIPTVALIVHKNMTNILGNNTEVEEEITKPNPPRMVLNSAVLTAVINSKLRTFRTHAVTFTFSLTKANKDNSRMMCAYWNRTARGKFWSPKGCKLVTSNETHTVCRTLHLSSFAVLLALKDLPDVFEVTVITYVGLSISLVCLLLAIATFATCQSVTELRRTIHIHLCLSLFVADLVFLIGISRTGNRVLCGVIAAILHYSFLSVFAWMFLEGIQLYLMVQVVFTPKVPFEKFIYWIGYGVPFLIVGVSAAINHNGYGTKSQCWLDTKNCFVCSFYVPAVVISIINFLFLFKTLMRLKVELSNMMPDRKNHRVFTLTAIGQSVILGSTWIFGAFYIQEATIPMMYIFTILNSFQGMFIFIMHCLMYKKVREAYGRGLAKCFRKSHVWRPVSTSILRTSLNQGQRSVQETESTTSGTVP